MNFVKFTLFLLLLATAFFSCSDDDDISYPVIMAADFVDDTEVPSAWTIQNALPVSIDGAAFADDEDLRTEATGGPLSGNLHLLSESTAHFEDPDTTIAMTYVKTGEDYVFTLAGTEDGDIQFFAVGDEENLALRGAIWKVIDPNGDVNWLEENICVEFLQEEEWNFCGTVDELQTLGGFMEGSTIVNQPIYLRYTAQ